MEADRTAEAGSSGIVWLAKRRSKVAFGMALCGIVVNEEAPCNVGIADMSRTRHITWGGCGEETCHDELAACHSTDDTGYSTILGYS